MTPGRTIGPGLLLDESANSGMFPPGAVSSTVTVTRCPSLNIGVRGGATGAVGFDVVWGGTIPGAAGATAAGGAGGAAEVSSLGLGTASVAGAGEAMGAWANGFGFVAICGGVPSPR